MYLFSHEREYLLHQQVTTLTIRWTQAPAERWGVLLQGVGQKENISEEGGEVRDKKGRIRDY